MHRFVLALAFVACTPRERPTAIVGTPLGESTAPGPRAPVYMAPDGGVLVAPVSPGLLAPRTGGNAPAAPAPAPAPTPTPAPAAPTTPAPAPAPPPPPATPNGQPGVLSPPPVNP